MQKRLSEYPCLMIQLRDELCICLWMLNSKSLMNSNHLLFSLFKLMESTDVALCSQLLVFVRYTHKHDIKINNFYFYFVLL